MLTLIMRGTSGTSVAPAWHQRDTGVNLQQATKAVAGEGCGEISK